MRIFANWKSIVSLGESFIPGVELESHAQPVDNIQFVVDIPDEVTRDEVVTRWIIKRGISLDDANEAMGFEDEWPPEVQSQFYQGGGERYTWSDL
jgi:hypothetical protein